MGQSLKGHLTIHRMALEDYFNKYVCVGDDDEVEEVRSVSKVLKKGKAQNSWHPCPNEFRSTLFYIENIIYLFYNTSYQAKAFFSWQALLAWGQCDKRP